MIRVLPDKSGEVRKARTPFRFAGFFVSSICPVKSEASSLNPNLLGPLIGPTKISIASVGSKRIRLPVARETKPLTDTEIKATKPKGAD